VVGALGSTPVQHNPQPPLTESSASRTHAASAASR
jgi:hypothetical protein